MELKVALCQFDMVWEDTAANLRTAGRSGDFARDVRYGIRDRSRSGRATDVG